MVPLYEQTLRTSIFHEPAVRPDAMRKCSASGGPVYWPTAALRRISQQALSNGLHRRGLVNDVARSSVWLHARFSVKLTWQVH